MDTTDRDALLNAGSPFWCRRTGSIEEHRESSMKKRKKNNISSASCSQLSSVTKTAREQRGKINVSLRWRTAIDPDDKVNFINYLQV